VRGGSHWLSGGWWLHARELGQQRDALRRLTEGRSLREADVLQESCLLQCEIHVDTIRVN
jgi:hypothetical protein